MFKDVIGVDEGSWSEERLLLAGGRDVLVTTPWCFMCPWDLIRIKPNICLLSFLREKKLVV